MERKILEWAKIAQEDLNCFKNMDATVEQVKALAQQGLLHYKELVDYSYIPTIKKGVVAYIIIPNFTGDLVCVEVFMYIKPEYRNLRLLNEIIQIMEQAGKENGCKFVEIGANIGYRDDKFLKVLSRYGYKPDTVKKEI